MSLDLEALRWTLAASTRGSLSAVAREAHVAQSTVSRAIARLEAHLDVKIFLRAGRSLELTAAGEALLPRIQSLLANARALEGHAKSVGHELRGELKLSLCSTIGRYRLLPSLLAWREQAADVTLDLRFEERLFDPRAEGLDGLVRAGRAPDSELRRTFLGDYGHVLVAAPDYVDRRGAPTHPDDLVDHATLAIRLERVWSTWVFHKGRRVDVRVQPRIVVTDAGALLDAACAGAGIAILPDFMVAAALARRDLVALLVEWRIPRIPVYALHGPTKTAPRTLRDALRVLKQAMAEPPAPGSDSDQPASGG